MQVGIGFAVDCMMAGCVSAGFATGRVVSCGMMVGEAEEFEDAQAGSITIRTNASHVKYLFIRDPPAFVQ